MKIAFATCRKFPDLAEDDRLAVPHLSNLGIEVEPALWEDTSHATWASYSAVVVRSTWNYLESFEAFRAWIDSLEAAQVRLLNPAPILRWNLDKFYLRDFEKKGIPIVPTIFSPRLEEARELAISRGWREAVLKPAISAGAFQTHRLSTEAPREWDEILKSLGPAARSSKFLLQPFLPEVLSEGEYSFLFYNGEISHAVVKRPKVGDYRVQEQFGGTFTPVPARGPGLEAARRVLAVAPGESLYARVDLIRTSTGQWLLGEIEMLEPSLYMAHDHQAPERFARAIAHRFRQN